MVDGAGRQAYDSRRSAVAIKPQSQTQRRRTQQLQCYSVRYRLVADPYGRIISNRPWPQTITRHFTPTVRNLYLCLFLSLFWRCSVVRERGRSSRCYAPNISGRSWQSLSTRSAWCLRPFISQSRPSSIAQHIVFILLQ